MTFLFFFKKENTLKFKRQNSEHEHSIKNKMTLHHAVLNMCVLFEPVSMQFFYVLYFI